MTTLDSQSIAATNVADPEEVKDIFRLVAMKLRELEEDRAGRLLGPEGGHACWTVRRPEHWVFEGTGLAEGESFGLRETIVGTEADGCDTELVYDATLGRKVLVPSGKDETDPTQWLILASCLAAGLGETTGLVGPPNTLHTATLVYHEGEPDHGGAIFNCATLDWAHGLRTSEETAMIARNVLRRCVA
eukprot:SAG11_NODE_71_length_18338_cov_14.752974_4_plen_189_part_00